MKATNCNLSSIYSLYQDEKGETQKRIDRLSAGTPYCEFSDELVTHRLWIVNDKQALEAFRADFAPRKLYIADGHHAMKPQFITAITAVKMPFGRRAANSS